MENHDEHNPNSKVGDIYEWVWELDVAFGV